MTATQLDILTEAMRNGRHGLLRKIMGPRGARCADNLVRRGLLYRGESPEIGGGVIFIISPEGERAMDAAR